MSQIVISVENLSKLYQLGQIGTGTLSRDLVIWWARIHGKPNPLLKFGEKDHGNRDGETIWALKDVNFTVQQGEVLGIIGRNGAGKSTLLKILSRVTAPTNGCVKVKGRIASLLEVGTGFHPELTGRENIYLNGSILGMTKEEVRRKFDEIVAFAEVEKFIDTPVKRYSSGMYVRLAFAVAAHLDPEILVVDEVLAVGDAEFQKKCLGKIGDVAHEGRTVLFVSHNMGAIDKICNCAIILENGVLKDSGTSVEKIIRTYLSNIINEEYACWENDRKKYSFPLFTPIKFFLADGQGQLKKSPIRNDDDDVWIQLIGDIELLDPSLTIGIAIYTEGELLYWSYQTDQNESSWPKLKRGINTLICRIPSHILNEGTYQVQLIGGLHCRLWIFPPGGDNPSFSFTINGGLSNSPMWLSRRPGLLAPVLNWASSI